MFGFDVLGHVALVRVLAVGAGHAGAVGEVRNARSKVFESVHLHQIEIVGDAVDQVQRMRAALLGDLLQHRSERRQARAAGQQEQRPLDLAQIEAAQRAGQVRLSPALAMPLKKLLISPPGTLRIRKLTSPPFCSELNE